MRLNTLKITYLASSIESIQYSIAVSVLYLATVLSELCYPIRMANVFQRKTIAENILAIV